MKFLGACNDAKVGLDRCFKFEKERKRRLNYLKSRRDFAAIETHRAEDKRLEEDAKSADWMEKFLPK